MSDITNTIKENYIVVTLILIGLLVLLYYIYKFINRANFSFDTSEYNRNKILDENINTENINTENKKTTYNDISPLECKDDTCKLSDNMEEPVEPENIVREKEVFNISDNAYTYNDAKVICKALDSELATFEQMRNAYNNGADWCNYGWSEDQMALYPTQKTTWKKLQKAPKEYRNECGHPGINGGYFSNEHLKFGANCYGYKPDIQEQDKRLLNYSPSPRLSLEEKRNIEKIKEFRSKREQGKITILPFKKDNWNNGGGFNRDLDVLNINDYSENPESLLKKSNNENININLATIPQKYSEGLDKIIKNAYGSNQKLMNNVSDALIDANDDMSSDVKEFSNDLENNLAPDLTKNLSGEMENTLGKNIMSTTNTVGNQVGSKFYEIPERIGDKLKGFLNNLF